MILPRKLIETALPLDDINREAAREKSIRHGHPSTLHLWWARRPLAAARAVIFAQMVNDPGWKLGADATPKQKEVATKKRNSLFSLIRELVVWENSNNPELLKKVRKEIRDSWRETCEANQDHPEAATLFNPEVLPAFHDPRGSSSSSSSSAKVAWFSVHGWALGPFGDADTLARAKGTSVDGVEKSGVLAAGSSRVRLLKPSEYPSDWDPASDQRLPVWEALHQLIRALAAGGEDASGRLLAQEKLQAKQESIRALCYRLYTQCERAGLADDARPYNELMASWHGVTAAAANASVNATVQGTLF